MIAHYLRSLADRIDPPPTTNPAHCATCGKQRHRTDKITYLAWKHDNCAHPQGSPLPESLSRLIEES